MPTRIEANTLALGVRLKQALLLTQINLTQIKGQISNDRFVHAVVSRLSAVADQAVRYGRLPTQKLRALERVTSACHWMLDRLCRRSSDDYLENLYAEFNRRVQLVVDSLLLDDDYPHQPWLNLGLEIADGSYDLSWGDHKRLSPYQIEDRWRWSHPELVQQLAFRIGVSLINLFPLTAVNAPWMNDLPDDCASWARLEAGLQWVMETAHDVPDDERSQREPGLQDGVPNIIDLQSLPSIQQRLYQVLDAAGSRLTTTQVLSDYETRFGNVSESQVKSHLAEMRRARIIDNRNDVRPPGYGILMRP